MTEKPHYWCSHCDLFQTKNLDTGKIDQLFQKVHNYAKNCSSLSSLSLNKIEKIKNENFIDCDLQSSQKINNQCCCYKQYSWEKNYPKSCHMVNTLCKNNLDIILHNIAIYTVLYNAKYISGSATIKPFYECYSGNYSIIGNRFEPNGWKLNKFVNDYKMYRLELPIDQNHDADIYCHFSFLDPKSYDSPNHKDGIKYNLQHYPNLLNNLKKCENSISTLYHFNTGSRGGSGFIEKSYIKLIKNSFDKKEPTVVNPNELPSLVPCGGLCNPYYFVFSCDMVFESVQTENKKKIFKMFLIKFGNWDECISIMKFL